MSKIPKDFMTVKQAQLAFPTLLLSERTVRRLVEQKKVRHWRVGGRVMLSRAQLEEDLAGMERKPADVPQEGKAVFLNPHLAGMMG